MTIGRVKDREKERRRSLFQWLVETVWELKLILKLTLEPLPKGQWWPQRWLQEVSVRLLEAAPHCTSTATSPTSLRLLKLFAASTRTFQLAVPLSLRHRKLLFAYSSKHLGKSIKSPRAIG